MEQDGFKRVAGVYDSVFNEYVTAHYLKKRVRFIRPYLDKDSTVLDLGCGTGTLLSALAPHVKRAVGVDSSRSMLRIAKKKSMRLGLANMAFCKGYAEKLPFPDESFDVVYSIAVFHHIKNRAAVTKAVSELVRITKKNGAIIIWDHNPKNPYWKFLLRRLPQDNGDERPIPDDEYVSNLRGKVFRLQILKKSFVPDFCGRLTLPFFKVLEDKMERHAFKIFCAHTVVVAVK